MHQDKIKSLSENLLRLEGRKSQLIKSKIDLENELSILKDSIEIKSMAQGVLDKLTEIENEKIIGDLQRLVTHGLRSIWGGNFDFKVVQGNRSDMASAKFELWEDGVECDILEANGGGIVGFVSFLIRVIFLLKTNPKLRPVLFLDEPFVYVSHEYQQGVAQLVKKISNDLKIKLLMVTHQEIFVENADHEYRLYKKDNDVLVKKVR